MLLLQARKGWGDALLAQFRPRAAIVPQHKYPWGSDFTPYEIVRNAQAVRSP